MRIISYDDLIKINEASLVILENIGVKVLHKKVYQKIIDAGCIPDTTETIAYFPRNIVSEYLKKAPKCVEVGNRIGEIVRLGPNENTIYWTCNALNWIDDKNKIHEITKEDFIQFVRLVDKLENVHGMVGTSLKDVQPNARDFVGFRLMLENTYKHLRPCLYTPLGAEIIIEMADVVLDGQEYEDKPFYSFGYTIMSPLTWVKEACEIFYCTSGRKIPMMINAEPLSGSTSPVTLAGSIALANAECLSGIVINQILEPGRPVIFNIGIAHVMDMKSAIALTGAPENDLMAAAGAELARYHGLPSASWMNTDSLIVDGQSCLEKMKGIFTHSSAQVNLIWGVGNLESTKSFSPIMAVIDNEIIGMTKRYLHGIEVNEDTIALDLIKKVGFSGDYMATEHTFKHFRTEVRYSDLLNRVRRDLWQKHNCMSLENKAQKTVEKILKSKKDCYLDKDKLEKIKRIENKWLSKIS